jgi:diadenosine tetraphosphate (Ap4A) HIT family hydrolase
LQINIVTQTRLLEQSTQHPLVGCELCEDNGGNLVFEHTKLRVVLVDDPFYPGFCRVIWRAHVREMTDLPATDRSLCMQVVCKVEQAMREVMRPAKINLASLGNATPHLHWHIIARYIDDAHYPQPVWGQQQRSPDHDWLASKYALLPQLCQTIVTHCASLMF